MHELRTETQREGGSSKIAWKIWRLGEVKRPTRWLCRSPRLLVSVREAMARFEPNDRTLPALMSKPARPPERPASRCRQLSRTGSVLGGERGFARPRRPGRRGGRSVVAATHRVETVIVPE